MRSDLPCILTHSLQPLEIVRSFVGILSTSAIGPNFGPILSASARQAESEARILEDATWFLEFRPKRLAASGLEVLQALRTEVVRLLGAVGATDAGLVALAKHALVVPRLVLRIADEVDQLYEWRRGDGPRAAFVNAGVTLLHGVVMRSPEELVESLGKDHRFMVSMARLAVSGSVAQEEGVASEVRDYAYQMLNKVMTPAEADSWDELFNSGDAA